MKHVTVYAYVSTMVLMSTVPWIFAMSGSTFEKSTTTTTPVNSPPASLKTPNSTGSTSQIVNSGAPSPSATANPSSGTPYLIEYRAKGCRKHHESL
ncbi:uncharacterized protein LOC142348308 isoform X2 [Convolutriloba macropyga]|uniref:uncharacterized protein LOC142348308 isoform X2 n=1 Tax=Convolutriloba macropyga TaxID=536237 RepID=UPI003F52248F